MADAAAIDRLLEEALGRRSGGAQAAAQAVDMVELTPSGLRLEYTSRSAEWLAQVIMHPDGHHSLYI